MSLCAYDAEVNPPKKRYPITKQAYTNVIDRSIAFRRRWCSENDPKQPGRLFNSVFRMLVPIQNTSSHTVQSSTLTKSRYLPASKIAEMPRYIKGRVGTYRTHPKLLLFNLRLVRYTHLGICAFSPPSPPLPGCM